MSTVLRYPSDPYRHTSSIIFKINTYSNSSGFEFGGESVPDNPLSTGLSERLKRGGSKIVTGLADLVGGTSLTSGASAYGEKKALDWFPQKKRLETIISLYMPHSVTSSYGADYSEISAGGLIGSVISDLADGKNFAENAANGLGRKVGSELASVGLDLITDQAKQLVGKVTRNIENPRRELVFNGVSIREFQFNFEFQPRNAGESKDVKQIIHLFKLHMHPDINNTTTSNGMFLTYPNDFDIEFGYRGRTSIDGVSDEDYDTTVENEWLHKIQTCVLTGMSVDYTGGGQWQSFEGGAPTNIRLSLQFRELEPLTRQHIAKGY